jgi:large subunit ribosomal protein L2
MGKNLRQQRRGRGTPVYRAPTHRFIGKLRYPALAEGEGKVVDIAHSAGKATPVAIVQVGGKNELLVPVEGLHTGQAIRFGGSPENGNVVELKNIPEGTRVCNIELRPMDGGKMCRAPGSAALVVTRGEDRCVLELPSKRQVIFDARCRATVGVPAGAGRAEKPFMKAGKKSHAMRATGRYWPVVSGVSKNPVDHPFGGKTKPGMPVTMSRWKPPGAKVGSVAARRTGKRKR